MQCKSLNVWSVYFFFNTLSCRNYFFQGVLGVYKIVVEIPEGWGGGYFSGQKLEIPGRRRGGGAYVKFPPWWGYQYFLELHIKCLANIQPNWTKNCGLNLFNNISLNIRGKGLVHVFKMCFNYYNNYIDIWYMYVVCVLIVYSVLLVWRWLHVKQE